MKPRPLSCYASGPPVSAFSLWCVLGGHGTSWGAGRGTDREIYSWCARGELCEGCDCVPCPCVFAGVSVSSVSEIGRAQFGREGG